MKRLLLGAVIFAFSIAAIADDQETDQKKRHIIIKTIGGEKDLDINGLLERIKAESGDHPNVFVTLDDDGNMSIDGEMDLDDMHVRILNMEGMGRGLHFRHGFGQKPMNEAAAECVLKSLGKVESDGEANLLREACVTIHAISD